MRQLLLIQGANMAWLGKRQPELYGTITAAELDARVLERAAELGCALDIVYTHLEGEAIATLYRAVEDGLDGLIMNPAGFTYSGHALRDAVLGCAGLPYIEVHMTNLDARGIRSVLAPAARGVIAGFGAQSYLLALEAMAPLLGPQSTEKKAARK
jgi:3-dehydroquinate dehydratase-2